MNDLAACDIPGIAVALAFEEALDGARYWRGVHERAHGCGNTCSRALDLAWAEMVVANWWHEDVTDRELREALALAMGGEG